MFMNISIPPIINKFYRLFGVVFILAGIFALFYKGYINWGSLKIKQAEFITVKGEASSNMANQVAKFSANVYSRNMSKEKAVADVNQRSQRVVDAIKAFGIDSQDVKTTNLNIYQYEDTYYENGVAKFRPGEWRANITIETTLRDAAKAQAFATMLTSQDISDVYGPNFSLDESTIDQDSLYSRAMDDAKSKATAMAYKAGRKLGLVISVVEGTSYSDSYAVLDRGMGGGGGAPLEPGSALVKASVTVTYSLE
jgi:uncharacterized protein YggE